MKEIEREEKEVIYNTMGKIELVGVVAEENTLEMTATQYQEIVLQLVERINKLESLAEAHEKWFNENEAAHVSMKKDTKTVLNSTATAFVFVAVAFLGFAFCIMTTNNKLVENANAINNNSYSIESIITSIKGGPAVD